MNYQWHYDRLVSTRKERIKESGKYYERHHIIPKSMGGNDNEENIILLTAREHFLAHWLLWRIYRNREMAFSFYTFCNFFVGKNHENRPKITSARGYDEAREAYSKQKSASMLGVLNSNRSKVVLQYDTDGNFLKEWASAKEAQRQLQICHITSCCRGERKIAGGFFWKYKNDMLKKSKPYRKRKTNNIKNRKPITQILNDVVIREYNSISEAVKSTGVPKTSIQANIAGISSHAGGFVWKQINNTRI